MKSTLGRGRWCWAAPTGYLNGGKGQPSLVIDPERGTLVARLFELVAAGHTKAAALAKVTALGLRSKTGKPLTQETVRKMLLNHLCNGEMYIKTWGRSERGDFEPLVSQIVFNQVQDVLTGRRAGQTSRARQQTVFPLRGSILCADCMKPVTASLSTGKLAGKFGYYRCHRVKGHLNVRESTVEDMFVRLLDNLTPEPDRMRLIEATFRRVWEDKIANAQSDTDKLRDERARLEVKRRRILEQVADGIISADDFALVNTPLREQLAAVHERLSVAEHNELDLDTALGYLVHMLWNPSVIWETSDLEGKQRLQRSIFPKGMVYSEKDGFGTP
jgi:site-specific DNA recombinase